MQLKSSISKLIKLNIYSVFQREKKGPWSGIDMQKKSAGKFSVSLGTAAATILVHRYLHAGHLRTRDGNLKTTRFEIMYISVRKGAKHEIWQLSCSRKCCFGLEAVSCQCCTRLSWCQPYMCHCTCISEFRTTTTQCMTNQTIQRKLAGIRKSTGGSPQHSSIYFLYCCFG